MNTAEQTSHIINGVDTQGVMDLATKISQDEDYGKFQFRARNQPGEATIDFDRATFFDRTRDSLPMRTSSLTVRVGQ